MLDELLAAVQSLSGDYAEAGVWRGEVAEYISKRMAPGARLWLFDSFLGHPEPGEFDDAVAHPKGRYADTSLEMVRARCPDAIIVPGFMPGSLEVAAETMFRFVRVDVDHYATTKSVVRFFRDRMVRGGIMEFDDYNHNECPGATKAIDEIIGAANVKLPAHWVNI
jgi:O-methyltransferase